MDDDLARLAFENKAEQQDFIASHSQHIDFYRAQVSSFFHFTLSLIIFPAIHPRYEKTFFTLYILVILQLLCAIFVNHVSFYSESNLCWDRIGWYVSVFAYVLQRLVVPIYTVVVVMGA